MFWCDNNIHISYMHLEHTFISSHEWTEPNRWAKFCVLWCQRLWAFNININWILMTLLLLLVCIENRTEGQLHAKSTYKLVTELSVNVILFIYFAILLIFLLVCLMFIKEFYEVFEWNIISLAHFHIHSNAQMQGHVPFIRYLSIFSILLDFVVCTLAAYILNRWLANGIQNSQQLKTECNFSLTTRNVNIWFD